ncbi:PqiC family protein, partial [Aquitalea magnusonii]
MSQNPLVRTASGLLLALALAGCSTAPLYYHQLQGGLPARSTPQAGAVILVEAVSLPAEVDRPQLLLQDSRGQPQLQEQHYWTASLSRLLTQALAVNLSHQLGLSSVYAAPQLSLGRAALHVAVDVRSFRLEAGEGATLAAAWRITRPGSAEALLQGYYRQHQAASGSGQAGLVAAQQDLLDGLSREIAAALAAQPAWL